MLMFILACAKPEDEAITLHWYRREVECVDSVAEWTIPDPAPVAVFIHLKSDGYEVWNAGVQVEDGVDSQGCTDDIEVVYALVAGDE